MFIYLLITLQPIFLNIMNLLTCVCENVIVLSERTIHLSLTHYKLGELYKFQLDDNYGQLAKWP